MTSTAPALGSLYRSPLFVPGDDERKITSAVDVDADVVIIDLEDAVANSRKVLARTMLADTVETLGGSRPVLVRVNSLDTEWCADDVAAVVEAGASGVLAPKLRTPDCVRRYRELAGTDALPLIPLIETAAAVVNLGAILDSTPDSPFCALGAGDLSTDLELPKGASDDDAGPLAHARLQLVFHSRASGLGQPVDGPELRVREPDRFVGRCERALLRGFGGILCLHPSQVEIANERFTPDDAAVEAARQVAEAFAEAEREGHAAITVDGAFVDYPIALAARTLLARREAIEARRARPSTGGSEEKKRGTTT